jgi:hypothetical protein
MISLIRYLKMQANKANNLQGNTHGGADLDTTTWNDIYGDGDYGPVTVRT